MRRVVIIAGLLLSAACLAWLVTRVNWQEVGGAVRHVGLGGWLLGSALYLCSFLPRALRWQVMLRPVAVLPLKEMTGGVVIGFAANNVLPMRLGEFVRAGVVSGRCQISRVTTLASVLAEKILDGLCLLLALFLGLHLLNISSDSDRFLAWLSWCAAAIFGTATVFMVVFACFEAQALALAERWLPDLPARILARLAGAFRFLKNGRVLLLAAVFSLAVWAVETAVFAWFLQRLGQDHVFARSLFCLAFVNLSILVPSAPGYIGVFQAGAAAAFAAMGLKQTDGVTLSLLVHSAQFIPVTVAGLFLAPVLGLHWGQMYRMGAKDNA